MTPENFKSHQLFEKIEQLSQRLSEDEIKEKIELDKLSFFESVHQYISDRIKLTIPILVQEAEMNSLSSEIEAGLQQINAFLGNSNVGHLNNATNNFNSALNKTRNFPLPFSKNDFNFSKVIADFQKSVSDKYEHLESENEELSNTLQEFKTDLESKDKEIERLFKLVEAKESEIQNLNSNFQTEFTNIKTKATQEYETDRKTFRTEIDTDKQTFKKEIESIKKEIDTDTTELIEKLETKLAEAKSIVNVIGNVGVTGNYQIIANEHKDSANFWRWVAIFFMAVFSGLLVWTIIDLSSSGFDWTKSLIRLIAAAALSYPATYAAKESSKHRKLETINRRSELELASINPFIEILDEDKKQNIKEKLVEKYFGNNHSDGVSESKEEEVSIGGFEKILKAVVPLLKK
ncbi:hypothetical protein [Fulvivirga sediminis]|uniref:Uncharacterized protein n=1 Tax=Fulvivirga sediminis TaxID=2803949 RepID=A0A937F899_9BACT|nr:hypothetical protein [Fulvivirga sediminis]MBL3658292.1 hypothetical protein [Fulvivirga sediminis]